MELIELTNFTDASGKLKDGSHKEASEYFVKIYKEYKGLLLQKEQGLLDNLQTTYFNELEKQVSELDRIIKDYDASMPSFRINKWDGEFKNNPFKHFKHLF